MSEQTLFRTLDSRGSECVDAEERMNDRSTRRSTPDEDAQINVLQLSAIDQWIAE